MASAPREADRATARPVGSSAAWNALTSTEALSRLGSSALGLSQAEASRRFARHGANVQHKRTRRRWFLRLADQFNSLLVYVLLAAAAVTLAIGHWVDAGVILAVLVGNALVGFFQEGRAEDALAAISKLLPSRVIALRDGARAVIATEELVPGDVVVLESGDRVPADLRIVEQQAASVDESLLTGESVPVAKSVPPTAPDLPLGERTSMAFSGSTVVSGRLVGVVVATGDSTELGLIGGLSDAVVETTTPLIRRLSDTGKQLTIVILLAAAVTFLIGLAMNRLSGEELFLAAIGLAVAAIPEGLPAIVTIVLAVGVRRMAAMGALIRRLPAVETLGSVDVICTDKTGTLTKNELVARTVSTADGLYTVSGEGYQPTGAIAAPGGASAAMEEGSAIAGLIRAAALCNEAELRGDNGRWSVSGDPIEGSLLVLALKAGFERRILDGAHPRKGSLPFESDHRYMATLHSHGPRALVLLKGAPERVLALCSTERTTNGDRPIDRKAWHDRIDALAANGLRVLGFAEGDRPASFNLDRNTLGHDLNFLGLVGFIDPARPEAIAAVAECRRAGIEVKMITGDHGATALAIAREVGIDVTGGVLVGQDLAALSDDELMSAARRTNVFARVDPAQKLRLVEALQRGGSSVAMTGDGVNDAPALRRADVGVAMGGKGSDAAKQAAEIVLVDDNFATITRAVREGRAVDDNLRRTLAFILPTNAGEALILIAAILAGGVLPVTALQIMWINFATELTLGFALAFEAPRSDAMSRGPRARNEPLLGGRALVRIAFIGTLMAVVATGLFHAALSASLPIEAARAVAVNAVVASEMAVLLSFGTFPGIRRAGGNWVLVASLLSAVIVQAIVTQVPSVAGALGLAPLGLREWGWVGAAGAVLYLATWAFERLGRLPLALVLSRHRRI